MAAMETGRKPVITYAGAPAVLEQLRDGLTHGLPLEPVEWRRSYGRPARHVTLEADFEPLQEAALADNLTSLVRRPCLHTFWTDCPDVDTYKTATRESLQAWLALLRQHNVLDWLVVVVESAETRSKANKLLPRSSVIDKVKADINSKHADRCVTLLDPSKSDSRSAGSLHNLLTKLRHFLLIGFNRVLVRFEDTMRSQREKRTGADWSFCSYFPLQEELAFVFQQLGLTDEALVQYDELDALFTQFVVNSCAGDTPRWLEAFSQPLESWQGLAVPGSCSPEVRDAICSRRTSLLAFRNYLYARQCVLLRQLNRGSEIAQRAIAFLFNTLNELRLMQLQIQEGGVACWAFVTCINVLDMCAELATDADAQQTTGVHTACLYDQARLKLYSLGELCGLLPGEKPSSSQLHLMVTLSAGMADSSPAVDKLKAALAGHEGFQSCYLELSELAMGTYKHTGRLRSARLVGRQLAEFHLRLGQAAHAASLLADALSTCQQEGWGQLAGQLQLQLARCYNLMDDRPKYTQMCALIAANGDVSAEVRLQHALQLGEEPPAGQARAQMPGARVLEASGARLADPGEQPYPGAELQVEVTVTSRLPAPLELTSCRAALQPAPGGRAGATPGGGEGASAPDGQPRLEQNIEYKQDRSLGAAALVCRNALSLLRRKDSGQPGGGGDPSRAAGWLASEDVTLRPGASQLLLRCRAEEAGCFAVRQLQLAAPAVDFTVELDAPLRVVVKSSPHQVLLNKAEADLLAGTVQRMTLEVVCGSEPIPTAGEVRLQCSRGLTMGAPDSPAEDWTEEMRVTVGPLAPFASVSVPVAVLSQLTHVKDGVGMLHKVHIFCPWSSVPVEAELHFLLPFSVNFKLYTANTRKFIQVVMHGLNAAEFELTKPAVEVVSSVPVPVTSLNAAAERLVVCSDRSASYLWEMGVVEGAPPVRAQFSVRYRSALAGTEQQFRSEFALADYRTLFSVACRVEPLKGAEFCRSGAICQLHVTVTQDGSADLAVMYEVLADQNMWAVCGRSSGVLAMGPEARHPLQLEVMPLAAGFLPLPTVRLSRYIPAAREAAGRGAGLPRLEPFAAGQVYNASRGQQVHVLTTSVDASLT